jgi:hypothetical protein
MPLAAAAAAAALIVGVVVVAHHAPTGVPPAQGGPAAWPTRGSLASDAALIGAAISTWEAAPLPAAEQPPSQVHTLYAGSSVAGDTVVLTGIDAQGQRRVVWLNTNPTDDTAFRHRLHLVADVLVPAGDKTGLIGLQAWRPTPRPTDDHVVIALGPPATRDLQWADQVHPWRRMPTKDGAALAVVAAKSDLVDVTVRSGTHGRGTVVLGDIPLQVVQPQAVDHEDDPATVSPSGNEHCEGNICSGSASVSGGGGAKPTTGGWADLGDPAVRLGDSSRLQGWTAFQPEAELMAQSLHSPGEGYSEGAAWSALLPDDTGGYLVNYTPGSETEHLILYVDRPEWYGGRTALDLPVSGPVPGIAALVPGASNHVNLIVVAGDGYRVQWSDGNNWHALRIHGNAGEVDVSGIVRQHIRYRLLDKSGAVVTQGRPSRSALY